MHNLHIAIDELLKSRTIIQVFNLEGQRAIGMIRVKLVIGDLSMSSIFHVIDIRTSYKLLLGRPWLHKYEIIASTVHQYLKYYQDGKIRINGNIKPFTKVESHFAYVRFFKEDDAPKETMPPTTTSTCKGSMKNVIQVPKENMPTHQLQKEEGQQGGTSFSTKQTNIKVDTTIGLSPVEPIFDNVLALI